MAEPTITQNATWPPLQATLTDADGVINLSAVDSVQITFTSERKTVSGVCDVVDAVNGVVQYRFAPGDTDTVGIYRVKFNLVWGPGQTQEVPNDPKAQGTVRIVSDSPDSPVPVEYEAIIADTTFSAVDIDAITPSVDEVALLLQTRTITAGGGELGTFTSATRPRADQVAGLIQQAVVIVLDQINVDVPEFAYPRIKQAVALQAAILVEDSFFREQVQNGNSSAPLYGSLLSTLMTGLTQAVGNSAGARHKVGSVVMRSTMTDWDPYYPLPPPPQVLEWVQDDSTSDPNPGDD